MLTRELEYGKLLKKEDRDECIEIRRSVMDGRRGVSGVGSGGCFLVRRGGLRGDSDFGLRDSVCVVASLVFVGGYDVRARRGMRTGWHAHVLVGISGNPWHARTCPRRCGHAAHASLPFQCITPASPRPSCRAASKPTWPKWEARPHHRRSGAFAREQQADLFDPVGSSIAFAILEETALGDHCPTRPNTSAYS